MSSRRRLRRRACQGKVQHATREAAHVEIRRIARTKWAYRPGLQAYRCPFCGHFHVGHPPRRG
jgi:rubrerythrin